jgi:hypothetical protein
MPLKDVSCPQPLPLSLSLVHHLMNTLFRHMLPKVFLIVGLWEFIAHSNKEKQYSYLYGSWSYWNAFCEAHRHATFRVFSVLLMGDNVHMLSM